MAGTGYIARANTGALIDNRIWYISIATVVRVVASTSVDIIVCISAWARTTGPVESSVTTITSIIFSSVAAAFVTVLIAIVITIRILRART